jgi:hypothetical protein
VGTCNGVGDECERLFLLSLRIYSDEGTLIGELCALPRGALNELAAALLRWN